MVQHRRHSSTHQGLPCLRRVLPALSLVVLGMGAGSAPGQVTPGPAATGALFVEGLVTDPAGKALAEAWVSLEAIEPPPARARQAFEGEPSEPVDRVTTGSDGSFRLTAPERGLWRVRVGKPGFASQRLDLRPLVFDRALPEVALEPSTPLTVRLRDAAGQPVSGRVAVSATEPVDGSPSWIEPRWRRDWPKGRTEDEGVFRLEVPDGVGTLQLEAMAPGRKPVRRQAKVSSRLGLDLAADAGHRLRALDPAGQPVPGVVVRLEGWRLPLALTDESGVARIVLPKDEVSLLELLGPAGERGTLDVSALAVPRPPATDTEPPPPIEVALRPPFQVEGRVVDTTHGDGLAGVLVVPLSGAVGWTSETDTTGAYRLTSLGSQGTLLAYGVGYHEGTRRIEGSGVSSREPTAGPAVAGPTLALEPAASFSGRVLDGERQPVAGAEVTLVLEYGGGYRVSLMIDRSDADGRFAWPLAPAEMNFVLRAEQGESAPAELEQLPYEYGEVRSGLELVLTPGLRGVGWVVDAWDEPVVGAVVRLLDGDRKPGVEAWLSNNEAPTATTGADGRFEMPGLLSGRFDLEAKAQGFAPLTVRGVELPPGEGEVALGTLVLAAGVELEGRVVDEEGRPIADARVVTGGADELVTLLSLHQMGEREESARSGREGRFVVGELVSGDLVALAVTKDGYVPSILGAVTVPTREPLRVTLKATSRVLGRVLDGDHRPVVGAGVRVVESGPGGGCPARRRVRPAEATTGDDGRFELREVEPGKITLETHATGFLTHRRSGLEAGAEPLEGVELVLERGATLEGTVFTAAGKPAFAAVVHLFEPDRGYRSEPSITDEMGSYRLEGLPPGPTMLVASVEEGPSAARAVEIQPGTNSVDIRLEAGYEVRGRVAGPAGEPVGGATVTLGPMERKRALGGGQETTSREGGVFVFEQVPEGTYQVWASRQGYANTAAGEPFEVTGPMAGVEARLRHSITLRGRVLGLDPETLGRVTLRSMQSWQNATRPDFEGRYQLEDLTPGDHRVIAELEAGGRRAEGRIRLEEGVREAELDLEFTEGALVTGTLFQADSVVSGARVGLLGVSTTYRSAQAISTHEGRFRLEGVPEGQYRLNVFDPATQLFHLEEVEIEGDTDLRIEVATSSVEGRVLLADGAPASGVRLQLVALGDRLQFNPETFSDSQGLFRFASVLAGRWRVRATLSGYVAASQEVEIEAGSVVEGLELRLDTAADLVLAMRHAGAPRPGAVWLAALGPQGGVVAGGLFQGDDQGRVLVDQIPAGNWNLLVETTGFARISLPLVMPRGDTEPLVLDLIPEGQIDVVVEDLETRPARTELRLLDAGGRPHLWIRDGGQVNAVTSVRGSRRRVENLAGGSWTVLVTTGDGRRWQAQVVVQPGEVAPLRLTGDGTVSVDP